MLDHRGVPAVYVELIEYENGEFLSGHNALAEIEGLGQLALRTMTAAEKEAARADDKRVQVVESANANERAPGEIEGPCRAFHFACVFIFYKKNSRC